jgi:hypothetical protein
VDVDVSSATQGLLAARCKLDAMTEADEAGMDVESYWEAERERRGRVWRQDFHERDAAHWYTSAWRPSDGPKPLEVIEIVAFKHWLEPLDAEFRSHDDWFSEHLEVVTSFICADGSERAITYRREESFSGGIPDTAQWLEYSPIVDTLSG